MHAQVVETPFEWQEQYAISQAHKVGNLVFTSGQAAIAPDGTVVGARDLGAQIEQTMSNLAAVLEAAGSSLQRVFKVTIYITDMAGFPDIVEMRKRWFQSPWPSDTIVQVAALGLPELLVEIEAVATVDAA
jgi:reactive intermediate/imine deaminase